MNLNLELALTIKYEQIIEVNIVIKVKSVGVRSVCFWKSLRNIIWIKYIDEAYKAIFLLVPEMFNFINNIKQKDKQKAVIINCQTPHLFLLGNN